MTTHVLHIEVEEVNKGQSDHHFKVVTIFGSNGRIEMPVTKDKLPFPRTISVMEAIGAAVQKAGKFIRESREYDCMNCNGICQCHKRCHECPEEPSSKA